MSALPKHVAATELLNRRRARTNLIDFARYIEVPGSPIEEDEDDDAVQYLPVPSSLADHHELILTAADRCIATRYGRLMLFMPPGSAKSTYGSIVVPAYAMGRKPGYKVIAASYGSDLARKMGRRTRSVVKQQAFRNVWNTGLTSDVRAADEWSLENGSEYMSGGILSGITGNRADLIVIDDPIKGRQDADSEAVRKNTIDAYEDDLKTRLKPGGSVILIQTRWHEGDLAGHLLPESYAGESGTIRCKDGFDWEVICLPAMAERADDPLGRAPGEYLWPEWFDEQHWAQYQKNARTWSALYQQRPSPDTGDYFKREWIHTADHIPLKEHLAIYGASDYAVTADGGDYTVHVIIGVGPDGRMYLLDLWRAQASSDVWVDAFCALVRKWKPIGWAEETGQIKAGVGPFLVKRMLETESYTVREQFPTRGDKAVRAQSIRGRMAMQGLYVPRDASWVSDLVAEMMSFPVGVHDDQVDALGLAGQLMDRIGNGSGPRSQHTRAKAAATRSPVVISDGVIAPPLPGRRH